MDEEQSNVLKKIKKIILSAAEKHGIDIDKIILFGSRARGDYKKESDWDILIVTKSSLNREKYISFYSTCIKNIFKKGIKKVDLIIMEKRIFEDRKNIINTIANEVAIEGIAL